METKIKNLLFQISDEIYRHSEKNEIVVLKKIEELIFENPDFSNKLNILSDTMIELFSDTKYKFFEYGIISKEIIQTINFEWKPK